MLGLDPGVDADVLVLFFKLLVAHHVQLCAGDGPGAVRQDTQLLGDGHGGIHMVAGDHDGADAGAAALGNGVPHLGAHRVDHAAEAGEAELLLQVLRLKIHGLFRPVPLGAGQHPQGPVGHGLVGGHDLGAVLFRHGDGLAVLQIIIAFSDNDVGRALGILDAAALAQMYGGHHLAAGVEGGLAAAEEFGLQAGFIQTQLVGPDHKGCLGGLAGHIAVRVDLRVAAEGHGGGDTLFILAEEVHHGHLVLGQGAGLIRADDLGAAQGLHRGQAADDGVSLGHVGDADGQHHRDHGGKALGYGRHGQGHSHHEGIQYQFKVQSAGPQKLNAENHKADAQHQPGEHLGQLAQLDLQGGLALLGLGQSPGDLAHLGVHAGGGDDGGAAAVDHGAAHVDHVFPVAQGDVFLPFGEIDNVNKLGDGHRLAGEGGLLDLQAGALQQAAVRGDRVAGLQQHHVAHHKLLTADDADLAVPQDLGGGGGHLLQSFNGLFRLVLLIYAQDGVDDDHGQDNNYVGKALVLHHGQHAADQRGHQEDDDHGVCHLLQETPDQGFARRVRQPVFAVCLQAAGRLFRTQALGGGGQLV